MVSAQISGGGNVMQIGYFPSLHAGIVNGSSGRLSRNCERSLPHKHIGYFPSPISRLVYHIACVSFVKEFVRLFVCLFEVSESDLPAC